MSRKLKDSSIKFLIIGPVLPEFKNEIETSPQNVIYIGAVRQEYISNYFSVADVLVTPSIQDGLATVQVQAAACDLPLIVSTQSGGVVLRNYLDPNFILHEFQAGDDKELGAILTSEREKIVSQSRLRKEVSLNHQISWKYYISRLISILS